MRPVHRPILVALAVLLAAACGPGKESHTSQLPYVAPVTPVDCASGTGSILGKFVAPNGSTPVVGATVTVSAVGGCTTTTNTYGMFRFDGLPAGSATVTATKGNFVVSATGTPGSIAGPTLLLRIPAGSVTLAYVAGNYDSIQSVLTRLGFTPVALEESALATAPLASYDAIFLNCGLDETYITPETTAALAAYVNGGGTLYASDWAGTYVNATFPGAVSYVGKVGDATAAPVSATVLDPTFIEALGKSTARIQFDLGVWMVIGAAGTGTTTLITGPATWGGSTTTVPFAVQFPHGSGRVTYTSFHNEAQATADMQRLLESIVFAL